MTMKLSSVVEVLGCACLLLVDGYPVSPRIIGQSHVLLNAKPGANLFLNCNALTNSDDDVTLIYWLVNDSFPEDAPSSDRIVELQETTSRGGAMLHRSLLLKSIAPEDFSSTFTCVVKNAAGVAVKHLKINRN